MSQGDNYCNSTFLLSTAWYRKRQEELNLDRDIARLIEIHLPNPLMTFWCIKFTTTDDLMVVSTDEALHRGTPDSFMEDLNWVFYWVRTAESVQRRKELEKDLVEGVFVMDALQREWFVSFFYRSVGKNHCWTMTCTGEDGQGRQTLITYDRNTGSGSGKITLWSGLESEWSCKTSGWEDYGNLW